MIIHNIIPKSFQETLKSKVTDASFSWHWQDLQINPDQNLDQFFGLSHVLYSHDTVLSNLFETFIPLLYFFEDKTKLKVKKLHRMQINLLTFQNANKEKIKNAIHIDNESDSFYSMIYYVIDSDGDTIIYDENENVVETCSPIAGNAIWFKSNKKHSATLPIKNKRRIVINCIFEIEEQIENTLV